MITRELAAFLQEGVGIHLGTRNGILEPNGCRGLAVTVDADGRHFDVFVATIAAARVLPDLKGNGQAAVGFGRPVDDRACQVKGIFVEARDAREEERSLVAAQFDAFLASLEKIGIPRAVTRGWITWPAVAIRVRATAIFDQTPGPGAGAAIA